MNENEHAHNKNQNIELYGVVKKSSKWFLINGGFVYVSVLTLNVCFLNYFFKKLVIDWLFWVSFILNPYWCVQKRCAQGVRLSIEKRVREAQTRALQWRNNLQKNSKKCAVVARVARNETINRCAENPLPEKRPFNTKKNKREKKPWISLLKSDLKYSTLKLFENHCF